MPIKKSRPLGSLALRSLTRLLKATCMALVICAPLSGFTANAAEGPIQEAIFDITTGSDDLRGNSVLSIWLMNKNGPDVLVVQKSGTFSYECLAGNPKTWSWSLSGSGLPSYSERCVDVSASTTPALASLTFSDIAGMRIHVQTHRLAFQTIDRWDLSWIWVRLKDSNNIDREFGLEGRTGGTLHHFGANNWDLEIDF